MLNFIQQIFSITKQNDYKQITILGLKIKYKCRAITIKRLYSEIENLKMHIEKLKMHIENTKYEIAGEFNLKSDYTKLPKIMTIDETLQEIVEKRLSVARFGDGEFKYLLGEENISQLYFNTPSSLELQERLKEIITSCDNNLLICLWDFFGNLEQYNAFHKDIARRHLFNFREKIYPYIDFERKYGNAFMSRPYVGLKDKNKSKDYFNKLKQIWAEKDIVIIEGEGSRLGVGNDLFDGAKSIERIIAPAENAWARYDEILEKAKNISKDKLVLIALGMTATVLAYDLSQLGFWAIDIGHVDIEYEWFLHNSLKPELVNNKYVNDVGEREIPPCDDPKYLSEIVAEVG